MRGEGAETAPLQGNRAETPHHPRPIPMGGAPFMVRSLKIAPFAAVNDEPPGITADMTHSVRRGVLQNALWPCTQFVIVTECERTPYRRFHNTHPNPANKNSDIHPENPPAHASPIPSGLATK